MNYLQIIALVIFVYLALLALYLVYKYFNIALLFQGVKELKTPSTLNNSGAYDRLSVPYTLIDSPTSVRYYYGLWVFIHSNIPPDKNNILFNKGNEFILSLYGRTLKLSGINGSATNKGTINPNGTYTAGSSDVSFHITDNFPFQKWVHIIICVDGQTVDAYLDGKLVASTSMTLPTPSVLDITIGNINTDGKITRFRRDSKGITPQGVWNEYIRGNGQTGLTGKFMPYSVDLAFSRNGNQQRTLHLF